MYWFAAKLKKKTDVCFVFLFTTGKFNFSSVLSLNRVL